MTRPPLELAPIVTNATNRITSPIESIPIITKTPDPTSGEIPTDFSTLGACNHVFFSES